MSALPRVSKAKTTLCALAVFLVAEAAANVVLWMHGNPWTLPALVATLAGLVLGAVGIHYGRCLEARERERRDRVS